MKILTDTAAIPSRGHEGDAGLDLSSDEDLDLGPGEWRVVKTGISVEIPEGFAGLVLPRSGLAAKHGITIMNSPGLIDPPYRGEVGVILTNLGQTRFSIEKGMRIAQLLVVKFEEVDIFRSDSLSQTDRGSGGFGSTGV